MGSYGDAVAEWAGAGCRRHWQQFQQHSKRGTIRSSYQELDGDRQYGPSTLLTHRDVAAQWTSAGSRRGRRRLPVSVLDKRGTIRSGYWDMDGDGQHGHWTLLTHGDVAAEWASAGSWGRQFPRWDFIKRGPLHTGALGGRHSIARHQYFTDR